MDSDNFNGFEINFAALLIAQALSYDMSPDDMSLLGSFLYTVADCLNTLAYTSPQSD